MSERTVRVGFGVSRRVGLAALLCAGWLCGLLAGCGSSSGTWKPGDPLTVSVGGAFPAGTLLREAVGGGSVTVDPAGQVTVKPGPSGVALLERAGSSDAPFAWQNAVVYFALTDRFNNGDPSNDNGYGTRPRDGAQEIGTWHGGDWKGLTQKLDYLQQLGATAIWISPIVEQTHGWVVGGNQGEFKSYAYAGYWALDFTRLDANWGTESDLQTLVDGAHQRGIRVLVDVVLNHPGYATADDLLAYLPEVIDAGGFRAFVPDPSASTNPGWYGWNNFVDYHSSAWGSWWSPGWIRAGLGTSGQFDAAGTSDQTRQISFLPDFKTESPAAVGLPGLLLRKADTAAVARPGFTVRDYLVQWHADWVRRFGIDGFRCDTALNVEVETWAALKSAATAALADWKSKNPAKKVDDAPFWMTGEVYGHGLSKDGYFTQGGFDSLINFGFRTALVQSLSTNADLIAAQPDVERLYSSMAGALTTDPQLQILSYVSSHDTGLMFADARYDLKKYRQAATALLLAPGAIQIFYGDESGRQQGPRASDATQGTRSDMNWSTVDAGLLAHFQSLTGFRKRHPAVAQGTHGRLDTPSGSYAFTRKLDAGATHDAVVVVLVPPT
jgi:alpha-amylase